MSESEIEDSENVSITDANGDVTMAEVNSENPYALILTREEGSVATVQAKADSGYEVV